MSNLVEQALKLAQDAHHGQFRKFTKEPYVNHPIRVGSVFNDDTLKIVSYLHDIVEDTNVTLTMIEDQFGKEVATSVDALTRRKDENYLDFILRASNDFNAIRVKLVDLEDNMKDLEEGQRKDKYRLAKYILDEKIEASLKKDLESIFSSKA